MALVFGRPWRLGRRPIAVAGPRHSCVRMPPLRGDPDFGGCGIYWHHPHFHRRTYHRPAAVRAISSSHRYAIPRDRLTSALAVQPYIRARGQINCDDADVDLVGSFLFGYGSITIRDLRIVRIAKGCCESPTPRSVRDLDNGRRRRWQRPRCKVRHARTRPIFVLNPDCLRHILTA